MKILFAQADFGGCGFYRVLQPAGFLKIVGQHDVRVVFRFQVADLFDSDLIILQRQYLPQILEAIPALQKLGKKVVYELDDDFWHVPDENTSKKYWEGRIPAAVAIIEACDAVTTSTEPLAELLRKYNKHVYVIPNYIPEAPLQPKFDSVIRIGWSGSISHKVDFSPDILKALLDIKKKYQGKVELVFCGWIPDGLVGHVTYHEPVAPMYYMHFLTELRLHIGIIPCSDIVFNKSKSNLKFLEYSITKTASIASAIYPYINTMTDDTGILIRDGSYDEWFHAMDSLIQDAALRNRLAGNAYEFVRKNYLITNNFRTIEQTYMKIMET